MNIAFPALLVFLIILPGFIFRFSFRISEKTVIDQTPFATAFVKGVIIAGFFHLPWSWIASLIGHPIDYNALLMLLASPQRESALVTIIANVADDFPIIILYFISLFIFAAALGTLLRSLVVKFKLDRNELIGPFVKFDTPWYYLFSGYHEAFESDGVVVSAIVEIDKTGYIYTGLLKEYFFAPDGALERIVIEMAMRRPLSNNKSSDENNIEERFERFYKIDGDYFVLRYSEIKTLNIEFLRVQEMNP
ncbi:hypothetical protein [Geotalea uraniireducens]|uniref:Uncharacterized protein n=1 Tax=Geotalea uraniireducens (strain Rf4) TaxID=351605 RepID=A5G8G0_GEOUR|nr:hypothetical protein [Geotalea uraniireducens]ABQ28078.1 hypothetical protein Gura_3930 [Geotalea uraniireducens Rf4]